MDKVVRTICLFRQNPSSESLSELSRLGEKITSHGFILQTKRLCSPNISEIFNLDLQGDGQIFLSPGKITSNQLSLLFPRFYNTKNVSFNLDLTDTEIDLEHTSILFDIIKQKASKTFNFTYTFHNPPSSPFFPSATFQKDGFSVGLQPTDLAENCSTLEEWLLQIKNVWQEIGQIFSSEKDFLGIDTSIAPLFEGKSSFLHFLKKISPNFNHAVTTDTFLKITRFIKDKPSPKIGLCGLMFPCLEDFELAGEYEQGNFSIERNLFLSLHSGLGIDTYPIGTDEKPERVNEILKLVQGLSAKYQKPLSVRFVSDGNAKIGQKTDFKNQYLKDVAIRPL